MTIRRKHIVPGLEDVLSDSSSDDDDLKLCRNNIWQPTHTNSDVIMIEDSDSDNSDIDIISVEGVRIRKTANEVWRNIMECDLLDERVKIIGLDKCMVHREVESYELPANRVFRAKRLRYNSRGGNGGKAIPNIFKRRSRLKKLQRRPRCWRRRRSRSRSRHLLEKRDGEEDVICLSSSSDELEIVEMKPPTKSTCKMEPINARAVINSDSDQSCSTDDDDDDKTKLNSWTKLMDHLHKDKFQIEFEDGRRSAATRIATELQEPKVDLIDRCLVYLGLDKCRVFLEATRKIEANGGMPTKDGSRRRTPGGVFLTMIKSDRTIEYVVKQQIFLDVDNQDDDGDTLWWKSLESFQYKRSEKYRGVSNYARKKEFKSYTLLDLDYFQGIRDFRYRYIPIMSNFPLKNLRRHIENTAVEEYDNDLCMITHDYSMGSSSTTVAPGGRQSVVSDLLDCGL